MKFTATSTFHAGRDDAELKEYEVRYNFTVTKPRAQTLQEPAEPATIGDIDVEILLSGKWHPCDHVLHDMIVCDDIEALEAMLLAEANEQARAMADEAADHRRKLQQEERAR
ncbi:hypothetical protein JQX09_17730 [Sulfitobacter pseudonitzschiae]|uniref:Uncharacterized protein n=1 Tax=Pseudosulfitobacter pseudonitzschiae TaxID=1402135 RepID=A0A9Q2NP86_9RHOB|nr:hypothetical protein [Pseudosulfitobacter pseudonitzschiae]MBM2293771.1 hypothetical protein [Pseudosulfitobacter pseudonitzschiae]MBM2298689.1 hypothetical protein [Pseudosulfitobacter pseudonitzschiae]MBM2303603.1 hypothetical protein [Pseudosulfitobacter pseudonitzschiae]MBM2313386.1 hypothetical protein [Pseudosulfitobacter pseudonitzschiae]MBM2318299.1 hypothetical protein [Pseudosulfitobacter pseudonitzschiae]